MDNEILRELERIATLLERLAVVFEEFNKRFWMSSAEAEAEE